MKLRVPSAWLVVALLALFCLAPSAEAQALGGASAPGVSAFFSALHYAAGTAPKEVAAEEVNNDGSPDLAVANVGSHDVSVLLGNGDGTFQAAVGFAAGDRPASVAVGDLNGDGSPDLAVGAHKGSVLSGFDLPSVAVNQWDFLYFVVDPNGNCDCDSTALDLTDHLVHPQRCRPAGPRHDKRGRGSRASWQRGRNVPGACGVRCRQ